MTRWQAKQTLEYWLGRLENGQSIFISQHDKAFQEAVKIVILEMERTMYEDKEVALNDKNTNIHA